MPLDLNIIDAVDERTKRQLRANFRRACKARAGHCQTLLESVKSQVKAAGEAIDDLERFLDAQQENDQNIRVPTDREDPILQPARGQPISESARKYYNDLLNMCTKCEKIREQGENNDQITNLHPIQNLRRIDGERSASPASNDQKVNHIINVFPNKPDNPKESRPETNANVERTVLVSKSNVSKHLDGAKVTEMIKNVTIVERPKKTESPKPPVPQTSPPMQYYFPFMDSDRLPTGLDTLMDASPRYDRDAITSKVAETSQTLQADTVSTLNPPASRSTGRHPIYPYQLPQWQFHQSQPQPERQPPMIPTAETMRTGQQLQLTPALSWTMLPICFYGAPRQPQPFFPSGQVAYPFGPSGSYANAESFQPPTHYARNFVAGQGQGYLPFGSPISYQQPLGNVPSSSQTSVNGFQNQPVGPTAPAKNNYPFDYFNNLARSAYQCSYFAAPTYQFPPVPGVSEYGRNAANPTSPEYTLPYYPISQETLRQATVPTQNAAIPQSILINFMIEINDKN